MCIKFEAITTNKVRVKFIMHEDMPANSMTVRVWCDRDVYRLAMEDKIEIKSDWQYFDKTSISVNDDVMCEGVSRAILGADHNM